MAVGEFWDVSANSPGGAIGAVSSPEIGLVDDPGEPAEQVTAARRARLSLAKMLPSDAKHRGSGRRASSAKDAGVGLDELDDAEEALRRRNDILVAAIKRTQDLYIVNDQRQIFRLAATDLFVEKAQLALGQRARLMWRAGIASTVGAVGLMVGLSAFLMWRAGAVGSADIAANRLVLILVELLASSVIVAVGVRYLISLSRSFFHENVTILAKQHGLGFGRLYVYTNPDTVRLRDLQDAFGLDLESTPIFLDIKAREAADTIYSKVTQDLGLTGEKQ